VTAMHGLILAGGEGSRLAADGVGPPKPLVELAGVPQVVRLAERFLTLGCPGVTILVRAPFLDAVRQTAGLAGRNDVRVIGCETPSSLHTLALGLAAAPGGPLFCAMVDTVMPAADWTRVHDASRAALDAGAAMVLAVTGYVDDENPLWVLRAADGTARRVGGDPVRPPCVTGGVYALGPAARDAVPAALAAGRSRMREYLGWFTASGQRVATVDVPKIVDLDRATDLAEAEAMVRRETKDVRSEK
jgi:NDP-sugar pyrophosphorylase family protein